MLIVIVRCLRRYKLWCSSALGQPIQVSGWSRLLIRDRAPLDRHSLFSHLHNRTYHPGWIERKWSIGTRSTCVRKGGAATPIVSRSMDSDVFYRIIRYLMLIHIMIHNSEWCSLMIANLSDFEIFEIWEIIDLWNVKDARSGALAGIPPAWYTAPEITSCFLFFPSFVSSSSSFVVLAS